MSSLLRVSIVTVVVSWQGLPQAVDGRVGWSRVEKASSRNDKVKDLGVRLTRRDERAGSCEVVFLLCLGGLHRL